MSKLNVALVCLVVLLLLILSIPKMIIFILGVVLGGALVYNVYSNMINKLKEK